MWGGAAGLITLGYLDNNAKAAIILYILTVTIMSCVHEGVIINHMDLTPNYAGVLMGLSNGIGSTGGLGAPLIVGYIVQDVVS